MKVFGLFLTLAVALVAAENELDPVDHQLLLFKENTQGPIGILTTSAGAPVTYDQATHTLNRKLMNNDHWMDQISQLLRERTPERVVHAMGTGAFGFFKVTRDISHICNADFLSKIGKKTPILVRFSTSAGNRGSDEYQLETRGFSIKFYTKHGNFDIAGFNTPVFSFKDPIHSNAIIHGARRNPQTNTVDLNMQFDMFTGIPQTMHMMLYVFSGRGFPASYRHMPGWAIHTYQVVNEKGESHFIRFNFNPVAGTKNLKAEEAEKLRCSDPNYLTKDLYRAIHNGDFPKWDVCAQVMTKEQVEEEGSDAIDVTRILPEDRYPCEKIGEFVLNKNPTNYIADIEQAAFCPCNVVPGILGAPDKLYEARRFIYKTAQLYRLGKNVNNIPVNCPYRVKAVNTYNRDGAPPFGNNGGPAPNYYPNSFNGLVPSRENASTVLIDIIEKKADNFDQARDLYEYGLTAEERTTLIENVVSLLKTVAGVVREKVIKTFTEIHHDLGSRLKKKLNSSK